ncbi:MAG TPA: SgcJ/EcaC family oxidoreductase [Gemmatimonadaceae bacterium]|nr:SgcJ/EcaC family oxidoreductase [Gemmatimonadaceae bacterium]
MATTTTSATAREKIEAGNARFMEAFGRRDAAAVAECYSRDAMLLPPQSEPVAGRDAIAAFWRGAMELGIAGVRLETREVTETGGDAYEVGRYVLHAADGGELDHGKYLVVWRREDDAWKLHRDIWNTSRPA